MVKNLFPIVIVLVTAVLAGFPLLHPGLHPTHDGEYHVIRFYEFDKVLRDGDWYPRWAPDLNNGYGVPLFNFVYPLPNYVAALLHLFGISFIDAFKMNMFFATFVGAIFFYLWSRIFWGNLPAAVSSVFYTFSPYHFVDIYIRGSVGEVWALALFPAFLWSITTFFKERKKIYMLLSSLFFGLIIFSHNILAVMFFVFAVSYSAFLVYRFKNSPFLILNSLFIFLSGLGLSCIFWLPALFETHYVKGLQIYNFSEHFPEVYQLFFPSWGSGFMPRDLANQTSHQIGVANLCVIVLSFALLFARINRLAKQKSIIIFFLVCFTTIFLLMLKVSLPIWKAIPFMNYFQFPWRFLSLETLFASFLAGAVAFSFNSKTASSILLLFAVFLGIGYTKPAYYHDRDDMYYISRSNFIDGTNSSGNTFNTIWMDTNLKRQKEKVVLLEQEGKISVISQKSTRYILQANVFRPSKVFINTAYFPGWTAFVDDYRADVHPNKDGLISFSIPQGNHTIKIEFAGTFVRTLSKNIFFFVLALLSVLLLANPLNIFSK